MRTDLKEAFNLRDGEGKFIVSAKIPKGILVTQEGRIPFHNFLGDEEKIRVLERSIDDKGRDLREKEEMIDKLTARLDAIELELRQKKDRDPWYRRAKTHQIQHSKETHGESTVQTT